MEWIANLVRRKWRLIGVHLEVDHTELEQIALKCRDNDFLCCFLLFQKWAAQEVSTSCPFTWKGVIETLDNSFVRESYLARQLEYTYM